MNSILSRRGLYGVSCILAVAATAAIYGCGGSGEAQAQTVRQHGPNNAINDVDGIKVGQYQKVGGGFQTGVTAVWAHDGGAMASAYVGGGWPGSINTDVLQPGKNEQRIDVAFLTGGSYFGLQSFGGIIEWLEQNGVGLSVGAGANQVDPLVAGAVVYDLNRGGTFTARPNYDFGRQAMMNASKGPVAMGNQGAGTGTQSSVFPLKAGLGTASEIFDGFQVGMITAVNAAGTAVDLVDCSLRGTDTNIQGEFDKYKKPTQAECNAAKTARNLPVQITQADINEINKVAALDERHPQTTISIFATNANLTRAQMQQLAREVNGAKAAFIAPFNTNGDGDAVFALSTGKKTGEVTAAQFQKIMNSVRSLAGRSIAHAYLNATDVGTVKSYCSAMPSACTK
jgi:L-aminopeptidase/D-esterase-like protein